MFHKTDVAVIPGSKVHRFQRMYPCQGSTKRISPTIETVRTAGKQSVNIVTEVLGQFWLGLQLLDLKFSLSAIFVQTFRFVVIQI